MNSIKINGREIMKKKLVVFSLSLLLIGCDLEDGTYRDREITLNTGNKMSQNQATPSDIEYSLERYNLIKRAYWVNGQREKALSLTSSIQKPLGYITLFTENGGIVGSFVVDGKVSSLNSFLTPDSEYYATSTTSRWMPDVDGSYGENDKGIFFFTPDGKYIEWTGTYIYSDIPMTVKDTVVKFDK